MIIHPVVSDFDGFVSGKVGGSTTSLTEYPIIKVREAQTQVLLKTGDSAVIGGLQQERDRESVHKVPFLGDIPYLGVLFKRTTTNKQKIELLIFIKATIIENEAYAIESAQVEDEWEIRAGMKAEEDQVEASEEESAEPAAEEKEEMVSFVNGSSDADEIAMSAEPEM